MRKIQTLVLGAIVALSLGGCIVIHSSAIAEKMGGGTPVSAKTDDMGILHVTIPEDFTQKANAALVAQCQSGKLTNVQTELNMRDFLVVQMYELSVSGLCQP